MKFSKGKRQVLPLGRSHILHQYRLRGHLVARELHRSGVLVGTVLNMSLRWTFAFKSILGCIRESATSRLSEVILCQERSAKKGQEHLSFEERLRQLGQLSWEKRRLGGSSQCV